MSQAEAALYRPLLHTIAYKIVGCSAVAEDMVQDTFLNWFKTERQEVKDAKAYLISSVRNLSLNYLKKKKDELFENLTPNLPSFSINTDISYLDIKHEIAESMAVLLKKLAPAERAVFVLKEVFNFDYADLPAILGKTSDNCRQLLSRAQQKLTQEKERFALEPHKLSTLIGNFKKATLGEFEDLIKNLKEDISVDIKSTEPLD
ncbi:sigma-70 family RNA polymerase sigma factor [Reichenbachiella carrageenanivorans]|uniref:Sigma-70 family RNA polymerase sigma factor n=1 Tax=Reichenbachiella carrageenanivorans TaxID=2979869 RepID=A0ABY6D2Q6_9BACT|nr:sigma-70 family RNA polymerase sigma factor [Reichenbachiella carrageenanivorans]UXX80436.1 sigma-70 family RNA polymerase sigma factor [Reichenbachiella carrageenanivorans]